MFPFDDVIMFEVAHISGTHGSSHVEYARGDGSLKWFEYHPGSIIYLSYKFIHLPWRRYKVYIDWVVGLQDKIYSLWLSDAIW